MKPKICAIATMTTILGLTSTVKADSTFVVEHHAVTESEQLSSPVMLGQNTRAELDRLLQERNTHPQRVNEIDAQIREIFTQTQAVLVLDMSGFSRITAEFGIIHTLAQIQQMQTIVAPVIAKHNGTLLKVEADNIYAIFSDVDSAVGASVEILENLNARDLHASIGIGYGEVLLVANEDAFGNEMNLASKLGEDIAEADDILLTESAFANITGSREWEELERSVSGLDLSVHRVLWRNQEVRDEDPRRRSRANRLTLDTCF